MNELISKTNDVAVVMLWLDVCLVMMECTQPPSRVVVVRRLSSGDGVYTTPPS